MITQDYSSHGLQLQIHSDQPSNYLEITVRNDKFLEIRRRSSSRLLIICFIYLCYLLTSSNHQWICHTVLITLCLIFLIQLLNLVENQSLKIIKNVGLEKSTTFAFHRCQRTFIPSTNLSGVVINEVIYFVSN